ncbi:MAG TPA: DUF488 family protein [Fimbriimonadaceae bacterium]|nr:DUF488 family protein [Fimbriimonadaceae bacterium]
MLQIKRVYEEPSEKDGIRILVDRLWPRGVSKERAKIVRWAKELAPSPELRTWFHHDPEKWPEFLKRYAEELQAQPDALDELERLAKDQTVTLIYSAQSEDRNQAAAILHVLESRRR